MYRKIPVAQKRRSAQAVGVSKTAKLSILAVSCGFIVVAGLFFAATQHFSAIDYSMKNAKLRQQIEDMNADKRRLVVARQSVASPYEIRKAAQRIGLTQVSSSAITATTASYAPNSTPVESKTFVKKTTSVKLVSDPATPKAKNIGDAASAKLSKSGKSEPQA